MTEREKLLDLIIAAKKDDPETGSFSEWLADCLIANGVTIPVRCKDCKHWAFTMGGEGDLLMGDCNNPRFAIPDTVAPTMCAHEFCSLGEKEAL